MKILPVSKASNHPIIRKSVNKIFLKFCGVLFFLNKSQVFAKRKFNKSSEDISDKVVY